jgi:Spy/CpxP family protein refolding chaperone
MKSLLILTLGALLACPFLVRADSATNDAPPGPPPGEPGGHHGMKFLTEAEKAEFKKAHDAALAADPTLAKEDADMKAAHDAGTPPDKEAMKAFHEKMDAAMVKADPAVAPILAKIKAHHHGPGGPPPPPPDSGT